MLNKTLWHKIGFGLGLLLLIGLGTAQFFKSDLMRLQFVLTLSTPMAWSTTFEA